MAYKIAVASTDGKVVNEHFGRCRAYLVFRVDDEQKTFQFESIRNIDPPCKEGEHEMQQFDLVLQALSDCRAVLTCRIGAVAERYITECGLRALEYGGFIEDALPKVMQYFRRLGIR